MKVAVAGDLPSKNVEPVSLACDPKTGTFVAGVPVGGSGIHVAASRDRGATWKLMQVPGGEEQVTATAIALDGEVVHLAWPHEGPGVEYRMGALGDGPSKWKKMTSPEIAGWKSPNPTNVGLVLDGSGKPMVVYYSEQEEGTGRRFLAWRPGSAPAVAFESKATTDFPNLALTFGAGRFGLLVSNPVNPEKSHFSMTNGAAWSKPSVIPPDGPRTTNQPEDIAIDSGDA